MGQQKETTENNVSQKIQYIIDRLEKTGEVGWSVVNIFVENDKKRRILQNPGLE